MVPSEREGLTGSANNEEKTFTVWSAVKFILQFVPMLLLGLFSVLTGYKKGYRTFSRYFKRMFPEETEEERKAREEATPPHRRWWAAEAKDPYPEHAKLTCRCCGEPIGKRKIKECPDCRMILHAECYDKPYGGSYETPFCRSCHERNYSR